MARTRLLKSVLALMAVLGTAYIFASPGLAEVPQCVSVTVQPDVLQIADSMQQMSPDAAGLDFMQSMIRLDLGAIGMSEQAVSKAAHPELRQFARHVVDGRSTEQDRFLSWILALYGDGVYSATKPMPADWRAAGKLECLGSCQFEVEYMLAMIRHDAGAIAVANAASRQSIHDRMNQAASNVARDRSAEIAQLQTWLACWYGIDASLVSPRQCVRS